MTKQEFDKKYVGNNLVVHCETEELANEFLDLAHKFGYRWIGGQSYKERNNWDIYENKTCYGLKAGRYGDVDILQRIDYTVLKFESLKENKLDLKLEILHTHRLASIELKKEVIKTNKNLKTNGGYKEMKYLLDLEKVVFNEKKGRTTLVFKDGWGRIRTSKAQLVKGDKHNEKLGFLIAYVKRYYNLKVIDNAYNRYGKYQTQLIVHLETMLEQAITKFTNLSLYQIYKLFDNLDKKQVVFGDGENRKVVLIERK